MFNTILLEQLNTIEFVLLDYYYYSCCLSVVFFWNLPGSVHDQVINPLYSSREVWFFIADPICSFWSFSGLLQVIQTI